MKKIKYREYARTSDEEVHKHLLLNAIGLDVNFINGALSKIVGMESALIVIANEDWDNCVMVDTYGNTFEEGFNIIMTEFQRYTDNMDIVEDSKKKRQ